MDLTKRVLEYIDDGMSEEEAYKAVNEDIELSKPLFERIETIIKELDRGFIDIEHLKIKLNSFNFNKPKISEKQIIIEVLKYSNLFYYINGLVISTQEDTFYRINKYYNYIKNLLKPYFNKPDIQYIVSFLFFYKRLNDINILLTKDMKIDHIMQFKNNKHALSEALYKLDDESIQINLIDDFINYLENINYNTFNEIFYTLEQLNTTKYNKKEFGKIYEYLIDKEIEHNFTNKSMQILMLKFFKLENMSKVLNPFGALGGLVVETQNSNSHIDITYNEINKRTIQFGYMTLLMYGHFDVKVNKTNSLSYFNDEKKYDYIITELPLARKFTQSELSSSIVQDIRYNNQVAQLKSIDSILYYLIFTLSKLKTNGKAIFNVPAGFLFSTVESYRKVREYLIENDYIEAIIHLPSGTMYHSAINTSLIIINKNKDIKNQIKIIEAKLLYKSKIRNREISESIIDIEDVLEAYNQETKESVIIDKEMISKKDYSLDSGRFRKEIIDLQNSLKDGKSKYLRELSIIKKGSNFNKNTVNNGGNIPIVKIQNLHNNVVDVFLDADDTFDMVDVGSGYIINQECILIASVGEQIKPTIYKPSHKIPMIFITTNVCALIPESNIDLEYLYYQMYSEIISEQMKNLTSGSIRTFLTMKSLGELIIPYIPIYEQKKFIDIQKSNIIAQERSQLEAKLKLIGYKEEIEAKESDIVKTLVHQLRATLSTINMEVNILKNIIKSNDVRELKDQNLYIPDDEDFEKPHDYTLDEISNKIHDDSKKLHDNLSTVNKVMNFKLRNYDFVNDDLYRFVENYIESKTREIANKFSINLKGKSCLVDFNKESFIELLDQLILNAQAHAFIDDRDNYKIDLNIRENKSKQIVTIEYYNNGKKFKVSRDDYLEAFKRGQSSAGSGIGGNYIYRILKAHKGEIFLDTDNEEGFKFKIELPLKHNGEIK